MKIVPKKRRQEMKTNYSKRRKLLEGRKPRIVIRKSNKYVTIQYIESRIAQDKVVHSINSKILVNYGWPEAKMGSLKSLGAAYLTGLIFGKTLKAEKTEVILDTGLIRSTKGSRVYAALKGIVESGVEIAYNEEVFPSDERLKSENIKDFFDKVKTKIEAAK